MSPVCRVQAVLIELSAETRRWPLKRRLCPEHPPVEDRDPTQHWLHCPFERDPIVRVRLRAQTTTRHQPIAQL